MSFNHVFALRAGVRSGRASILTSSMRPSAPAPGRWWTCASRTNSRSGTFRTRSTCPCRSFDPKELPQGKPVVLICQAGGRSKNALNRARATGRDDVRHYAGGMNGWRTHGGDVTL